MAYLTRLSKPSGGRFDLRSAERGPPVYHESCIDDHRPGSEDRIDEQGRKIVWPGYGTQGYDGHKCGRCGQPIEDTPKQETQ